jgi:hypothetical protein
MGFLRRLFYRSGDAYPASDELMDGDKFWQIMESSYNKAAGDFEGQQTALTDILRNMDPKEIILFDNRFRQLRGYAYTWKLLGAIYLIHQGCGDDSFIDFRDWLISRRKEFFYRTIEDPDTLANLNPAMIPVDMEGMSYIAPDVFDELTNQEIPAVYIENHEIKGRQWKDEVDLKNLLPALWKKYRQ